MNFDDEFNFYGDESCHILYDNSRYMVLGAIRCRKQLCKKVSKNIKEIKIKYGLSPGFEIKSTKVSNGRYDFYKELIEYFLSEKALKFRAVIVDKSILDHKSHNQTHEDFYYKMYFYLFREFVIIGNNYIYLDYKDSSSYERCKYLNKVLNNNFIRNHNLKLFVQQIDSKESNLLQLSDLLIGLICYNAKGLDTNKAKLKLIDILKSRLGISLFYTNSNIKLNIFKWSPK